MSPRWQSGPQKLISHFDGNGCWLTNCLGLTVASRSLYNLSKHLYTINLGSPLVKHSFIASGVPDLETWHGHLGHVNLSSSVATAKADIFRKNAISVENKFAKIMKIFDEINEVKSRRVI
jgi:hypothetical protein